MPDKATVEATMKFLSTPSARRATLGLDGVAVDIEHFYPRPPRGGRRPSGLFYRGKFLFLSTPSARRATVSPTFAPSFVRISIHALREEGDQSRPACDNISLYFYPRPPRGGRPCAGPVVPLAVFISIHALREEGDSRYPGVMRKFHYFYPRPPRGGRPLRLSEQGQSLKKFLSTPSARRATQFRYFTATFYKFLSTPSARRATHERG